MSRRNRYYPPEFKREALEMPAAGEHNMAQLERELGITPGLLRQWRRSAELRGEYTSLDEEPMTPLAAEAHIRRLERARHRLGDVSSACLAPSRIVSSKNCDERRQAP